MIGGDVDDFVRRTVEEGGYVVVTHDTPRVALLGTLIAVPAVVAGYLVALAVVQPLWTAIVSTRVDIPHPTGAAAGWVAVWVVGVLAVFTALAVCLHGRPAARTTLAAAAVTVPLAATVAIACSITVVEVLTITPGSIAVQVAGVLLPLVGSLALARRWGLHRAQSFAV